jgi:transcriptional regulator with XRE-family HTH domain
VIKSAFTRKHETLRLLLIQARKEAKLTQVQLAKKLARPQSFVSKFERGERRLDVIEFLDVTSAIGIDPVRFLQTLRDGQVAPKKNSQ